MEKVKMVLIWCIPLVLIAVALATPVVVQAAPTIRHLYIWPDKLIPVYSNRGNAQSVELVAGQNEFYYPVYFEVGTTINKILYYHLGSSDDAYTWLMFRRIYFGYNNQPQELVFIDCSINNNEMVECQTAFKPFKIKEGCRHYISVYAHTNASYFMGAVIVYTTP